MKGEIRGLKVGRYWSHDDSTILIVRNSDDGVIVEVADFDADIFYAFVIDDDETTFAFGHISEEQKEN